MDLTIRACRICLNTDVKMFFIDNFLENDIQTIWGSNDTSKMPLLKYMCYECMFLLAKFVKFRKKYITAQSVLLNMIKTYNKVTEQDIRKITLKSDLCHHKLPPISITEEVYMTLEMTVDEETAFEVKPVLEIKPDVEEIKVDSEEMELDECGIINDVINVGDQWGVDDVPLENPLADNNSNTCKNGKPEKKKYVRQKTKKDNIPERKSSHINKQQKAASTDFTNSNGCINGKPEKKKYVRKKKSKDDTPKVESNKITKQQSDCKDYTVIQLSLAEQLADLEKRKETCNYKDALFKCEFCYKGFLLEGTYRNHAIKHDVSSGDLVCAVCKFRFTKQSKLTHHAAIHAFRYACNKCDVITSASDQMKKHIQWHDGVLYKCQYCDEVLTKKTSFLSHLRIKHPSQFVCDACGYSYISALGLKQHKSRMHKHLATQKEKEDPKKVKAEKEESSMYCEECDMTFLSEEAWKRHTVTSAKHREQIGLACRDCGSCFPSESALRAHSRSHDRARRLARHRVTIRRLLRRHGYPRPCEHCPEILTTRLRHWKHYQRCHRDKKYPLGNKKFICEYCGKSFQTNSHLRGHTRASCVALAVSAPLACEHCRQTLPTRLDLQEHILKEHKDVPSFPCKYCGKVFWRATNVSQHAVRCKAARKKAAT
ncbi:zinc finger protein 425 isoform X2 [Manduca sexta]|uniref:zinc finger protein 425 isoform X2 n=1 Tax=Manduca sexta TaxID=7130 RepID=UPI00188ED09B|nr:zinc finger protein 425 isoform X2 [Manduca sexta]